MSSTITACTLAAEGNAQKQAALLKHFRADSIGNQPWNSFHSIAHLLILPSEGLRGHTNGIDK